MKSKFQKILGLALATVSVGSVVAMAGCSKTAYKGDPINDYVSGATVSSTGASAATATVAIMLISIAMQSNNEISFFIDYWSPLLFYIFILHIYYTAA